MPSPCIVLSITKIVKHRLHVCVQNAGVFWCSGVSQEMKIKDVHEMYSWIQMRREWVCVDQMHNQQRCQL